MRLTRFLKEECIRLELQTEFPPPPEGGNLKKYLQNCKELVIEELADILVASGKVVNPQKLLTNMIDRERKASTAIGDGLAIPHVRTMQARELAMAFVRSTNGVYFESPDNIPVNIFIAMVTPPYEDREYLKIYRSIGVMFSETDIKQELMEVTTEGEVIRILNKYC